MKIIVFCVLVTSLLIAGCAKHSLTPKQKIKKTVQMIIITKRNIKTAPCAQIDRAMAASYSYGRLANDPNLLKKRGVKNRAVNLVLFSYYNDFSKEFKSRCPGTPIRTLAIKKVYPDIIRNAKARRAARSQ